MALTEVKTKYGTVRGTYGRNHETAVFKGIPFAKPPVGENRWRAPQEPENWEGVLETKEYRAIPMQMMSEMEQKIFGAESYPVSEDCLYLNVWTSAKTETDALPVVVWVYGGAYRTGSSTNLQTDGENFALQDCVFVSFNYRVGPLGFLAHEELSKESEHHVSGNYGTLDQIAALRWVHENIAAFGGDPGNITLMGQSAGAHSVMTLCNTPLTEGLVQRAIIQSTAGLSAMYYQDEQSLADAEKEGGRVFETLGVKSIEEARALPAREVVEKLIGMKFGSKAAWFPKTDGYVLPLGTISSIMAGKQAKIDYLCGSNAEESGCMPPFLCADPARIDSFGKSVFRDDPDGYRRVVDTTTESGVRKAIFDQYNNDKLCALLGWQELELKRKGQNFYQYFFTTPLPGDDHMGACHGCELGYVFGTFALDGRPYTGKDYDLSKAVVSYWTNFIKTGNPNGEGLPAWERYSAERKEVLELGDTIGMRKLDLDENQKFVIDYMLKQAKKYEN